MELENAFITSSTFKLFIFRGPDGVWTKLSRGENLMYELIISHILFKYA